jgi:signal transduction histidine kinase
MESITRTTKKSSSANGRTSMPSSGVQCYLSRRDYWEDYWSGKGGWAFAVTGACKGAELSEREAARKHRNDVEKPSLGLGVAQPSDSLDVAAELHDDFSQRVALLVFGLRDAQETLSTSSNDVDQKLEKLKETVRELGDDLHAVSHRLHSATLDKLGLVSGLRAMCREFSDGQGIQIAFLSEDVPAHISRDVALCLFRIVQEALQNLKKHSGAEKAQVRLRKSNEKLFLTVCDEGKGFDAKEMSNNLGLGIGSMQGGARLLGGEFEIHSERGKGTRIEVWVPLPSGADHVKN